VIPNVFVSSTILDLQYLRDAVRDVVIELGLRPVMSEYSEVGFVVRRAGRSSENSDTVRSCVNSDTFRSVPRGPRLDAPGVLHHVMVRGIGGAPSFGRSGNRADFVDRVAALAEAKGWTVAGRECR
jgi:hypothetical protein